MKDYKTPLFLFLLAIILITFFSCCSWIYPLQPHDDANVFMSIGKSMLSGKLLYTDIHDQKGPLLFFLHEWSAVLSSKTFIETFLSDSPCKSYFSYASSGINEPFGSTIVCPKTLTSS